MIPFTLNLARFRCYEEKTVSFQPGVNLITGPNGIGKTSILEALSLFSPGRGIRGACNNSVQKNQTTHGWRLKLSFKDLDGPLDFETGSYEGRKKIYMNHALLKNQGSVSQWLSMIWPMTHPLDSMTQRRISLNRLIFSLDLSYADDLLTYDKALKQRFFLLQQGERNAKWYTALEEIIAARGLQLLFKRNQGLVMLTQELQGNRTPFPIPTLLLEGDLESMVQSMEHRNITLENNPLITDSSAVQTRYRTLLEKNRTLDYVKKSTQIGPHKTKFRLIHPNGRELSLCSMGEQKGMILSLALATQRLCWAQHPGTRYFLLLDEVMAHLDDEKKAWLWCELKALSAYGIATGLPNLPHPFDIHHISMTVCT